MFFWFEIYNKLREQQYNREFNQAKKETEEVATGFWELYHLAATFHGRFQLMKVVTAATNDEIDVDPKVVGLYQHVLKTTPYHVYAMFN